MNHDSTRLSHRADDALAKLARAEAHGRAGDIAEARRDVRNTHDDIATAVREGGLANAFKAAMSTPKSMFSSSPGVAPTGFPQSSNGRGGQAEYRGAPRGLFSPDQPAPGAYPQSSNIKPPSQWPSSAWPYTEEERAVMAHTGEAMPDGGFPIKVPSDVASAIDAWNVRGPHQTTASRKHILHGRRSLAALVTFPTTGAAIRRPAPRATTVRCESAHTRPRNSYSYPRAGWRRATANMSSWTATTSRTRLGAGAAPGNPTT